MARNLAQEQKPMDIQAQIVDQRVRALAEEHKDRLVELDKSAAKQDHKRWSMTFVALCVSVRLDLHIEEALDLLTDGGGDLGIDAIHLGDERDHDLPITVFQGKYAQKLTGDKAFPANEIGKLIGTVRMLFDPNMALRANERLRARIEEIRSLVREGYIPVITLVLCNNGKTWDANGQAQIDVADLPEDQVFWEHIGHQSLLSLLAPQRAVNDTLLFEGASAGDLHFRGVLVGRVPVSEIARLFESHGPKLLERNVRRYLGLHSNRVNKQIAGTLREADQRKNFYFFNNGLTLICKSFRWNALQSANYQVRVKGLQVINGGQTGMTIERVLGKYPDEDYSDAQVLVRLYAVEEEDADFVSRITLATNSQSPVGLRDLRANDEVQRHLAIGLKVLGFTYLHKQGGPRRRGDTVIGIEEAAEAVLAVWRRMPHVARFQKKTLFNQHYDLIFKDLNAAQLAIAVMVFRAAKVWKVEKFKGTSFGFLPYAAHFLAALIGEKLLRRVGLSLEQLDHRSDEPVLDMFEEESAKLFTISLLELLLALSLIGLHPVSGQSLQRLSAVFRRGELLDVLNDVRGQSRPFFEQHRELAIQYAKTPEDPELIKLIEGSNFSEGKAWMIAATFAHLLQEEARLSEIQI